MLNSNPSNAVPAHRLSNLSNLSTQVQEVSTESYLSSFKLPCFLNKCVHSDLSKSVFQWTDRLTGRSSRETDLLPLLKRSGGNPVEVSIANPTAKAREGEYKRIENINSVLQ